MSNAQDLGNAGSTGGNFTYGGINNTYNNIVNSQNQGSVFNTYGGIANNQSSAVATSLASTTTQTFQNYTGYASSFTGTPASNLVGTVSPMDNQPVLPWPKDQQIYYKLVGFNTSTQTFETWVIAEEIVPRPETFDPTGNFPNIDYNVFFTPPSGNKLVNIKIVGRWIQ